MTVSARGRAAPVQSAHEVVDAVGGQLGRRPAHTQPGADLHDGLHLAQVVLPQRLTRGHQIDDPVGQPHQGGDLDRAVQLDDLGDDAPGLQVPAGDLGELGGVAQVQVGGLVHRVVDRLGHRQIRQRPMPRSTGSYRSRPCSSSTSRPAMPRSAAPYST